ncbi:MAG: hypothetical protein V4629_06240 [Pseudomonadota bacterium]
MHSFLIFYLLLCGLTFPSNLYAFDSSQKKWTHKLGSEFQYFPLKGTQNQEQANFSIFLSSELYWESDNNDQSFTFLPYVRLDQQDPNRTHFDLREAHWDFVGDWWEVKTGITRVFWGKTEFVHLVDIINQRDGVEGLLEEEKLGQPMINGSFILGNGVLDLYVLAGFRERTFAGEDGRLRLPLLVDAGASLFDNTVIHGLDFAARWEQPLGDYVEAALSHFSGLSRNPTLLLDDPVTPTALIPFYETIDQTGLELGAIINAWAYHLEAITVSGQDKRWNSYTAGVEYTWGNVMSSGSDFTGIVEYIRDNRDQTAPTFLEKDLGFALRWAANDIASTQSTFGLIIDPKTKEKITRLEFDRRLNEQWKIAILIMVFESKQIPSTEKSYYLKKDDFLQLQIIRFF